MKINNFRGELTDISAKKEALITISLFHSLYIRIWCAWECVKYSATFSKIELTLFLDTFMQIYIFR